ncbi:RagB/SusD family nutrient uptake outer membrane protein [Maribacter sp. ACAM166]|uniref:RagB/SusD family nutrient uptake outer membrane protein n=1 Tax=Maribacter sp. ACAM166 TaxID=2508996 RepID=UPI0010FF04CC|nr:RagB/SusD family nutrient uptake outer membrane protein [Maribacter sp. ACAM166]TLP79286.1 RagB/SusD family nutrient uptake outer membrane protein [Maribacter sp. ACAM166]
MKRKIIYFAMLIGILACSDDFTDLPQIGAFEEEFLQTEEGANLFLASAYSMLTGRSNLSVGDSRMRSGDNWFHDVLGGDAHKGSTDNDLSSLLRLELGEWDPSNEQLPRKWATLYAGVNRSNAAINAALAGGLIQVEAQARFIRAIYYIELTKMWGNVSVVSEENFAALEFNQPNSGPAWAVIESDLQFAIANLPTRVNQPDAGRPSTEVAMAFLGKAQLYQSNYTGALASFNSVINSGAYSLNANYLDNFRLEGENGPESIFAIQFLADGGASFNANPSTLNFPRGGGPFTCCGFYQPSQDLVNAYQTDAAGLPLLDTYNQPGNDVTNDHLLASSDAFTPHTGPLDPRLDYTVSRRGYDFNGFGIHTGQDWIRAQDSDISGPYISKKNIHQAGDGNVSPVNNRNNGVNYNMMRYADLLLMAAEAEIEAGSLENAFDYVNLVRMRAKNGEKLQADGVDAANYVVEPYTTAFADQAFARKAVRFERRIELGMEGHRFFDLARWGVSKEVLDAYYENEGRTIPNFGSKVAPFDEAHVVFPIPTAAIDLSEGNLTQNPGY